MGAPVGAGTGARVVGASVAGVGDAVGAELGDALGARVGAALGIGLGARLIVGADEGTLLMLPPSRQTALARASRAAERARESTLGAGRAAAKQRAVARARDGGGGARAQ